MGFYGLRYGLRYAEQVVVAAALDGSFKPKRIVHGIMNDRFNTVTVIMSVHPDDHLARTKILSSIYVRPKDVFIRFRQPKYEIINGTKIIKSLTDEVVKKSILKLDVLAVKRKVSSIVTDVIVNKISKLSSIVVPIVEYDKQKCAITQKTYSEVINKTDVMPTSEILDVLDVIEVIDNAR